MRRFLPMVACFWWLGCASIGPPLPPSLELPKAPVDLHAERKGDKVTLTWTIPRRTTDRRILRYLGDTQICRGLEPVLTICGKPVGEVSPPANYKLTGKSLPNKVTASFVDTLPGTMRQEHPTGFATYSVEVLNTSGRGVGLSNQVHVPLLPTLPPFNDFASEVTAQGVLLTWHCPENLASKRAGVTYLFRIYRRALSGSAETKVADANATECAAGQSGDEIEHPTNLAGGQDSFLDKTFEWQKTYFYWGAVVSVMAVPGKPPIEVEGDDTQQVKVFANDVFPPAAPTGLQTVSSGPGQAPFVDLIWTPDTEADLAGYNVYRRENGGTQKKLNSEPVQVPAFRDTKVAPNKTYFYSVSAIDQHGNESARSEEASEMVP
ncbi:MAG: hypothetical protein WA252_06615 [Candidatus Sulfotelmatobacter sp.]